jgi:hypothetical protein
MTMVIADGGYPGARQPGLHRRDTGPGLRRLPQRLIVSASDSGWSPPLPGE